METEELSERLTDAEALLALQDRRLKQVENREIKTPACNIPDYTASFEEIKQLLRTQHTALPILKIDAHLKALHKTISGIPKVLPVKHHHHLEDSALGFIGGGFVLLLLTAVSASLCFSLYRENSLLQERSLKYRLTRLYYPAITRWMDSTYSRSPDSTRQLVESLEARQQAILQAQELEKRKQEEAREATQKLEQLLNGKEKLPASR
ncbi:hypothetical protein [Pontibacter actiniarum]|uniref:Uncharacterized protein n=1 Tax=Pontibacter actiniarum TaxID=323450 RepID=A0A1X9YTB3_9BACT|nr:hypothetical protein [Pontibacter actiniarum]ARS36146.1 hypothetical protein CA264_12290 [Pontibacter actiniarum]